VTVSSSAILKSNANQKQSYVKKPISRPTYFGVVGGYSKRYGECADSDSYPYRNRHCYSDRDSRCNSYCHRYGDSDSDAKTGYSTKRSDHRSGDT